jgi:hypothetical protein
MSSVLVRTDAESSGILLSRTRLQRRIAFSYQTPAAYCFLVPDSSGVLLSRTRLQRRIAFSYQTPAAYCFLSVRDYVKGSNGALNWPFLDVPVVFF